MHTVAEAANALALMSVTVKVAMRVKAIKIFLIIVIYPDSCRAQLLDLLY